MSLQRGDRVSLPITGRVTSPWGTRIDPFEGTEAFHNGIDMADGPGTLGRPVASPVAGTVLWSYDATDANGKLVVVLEDGNQRRHGFAHLNERLVQKGDRVEVGQHIGTVGNTGRSRAPHLHYGVKEHQGNNVWAWVDPTPWVITENQTFDDDGGTAGGLLLAALAVAALWGA